MSDGAVHVGSEARATRAFAAGEEIGALTAREILPHPSRWTIQVGPAEHLVIVGAFAWLNHSCRPNTRVVVEGRRVIALRAIALDEPLTFFYPSTEWEMAEPFGCGCGEPGCLGIIRGARDLPPAEVLSRHPARHIRDAIAIMRPG